MNKQLIFSIVVLAIIVAGGYFLFFLGGKTEKVTVSPKWLNQAQFAGIFVADQRGFYKKEGIDVSIKEFTFQANQVEDLLSGETDFAIISAEELILFRDQGRPIKALAAIYQISPYTFASLKEENILHPGDLAGKVLGNKGGKTEEDLFYQLILSKAGVQSGDANIVHVGFDRPEYEDLTGDFVDTIGLYRTDQLYFFEKNNISYNLLQPERFGINIYNDIIVTTEETIQSRPELVRKFVKATIEGWEEAVKNPEKAVEHTLLYVSDEAYKDPEYERFILENSIPLIKINDRDPIGRMTANRWEDLYQAMKEGGFVKSGMNISEVFTTEFLP